MLLRGLVLADLGRALQVLVGEIGLNGRGLDANRFAFEERLEILDSLLGSRLLCAEVERLAGARNLANGEFFAVRKTLGVSAYGMEKLITSLRLSVIVMPAMMASYSWLGGLG